MLKNLVIAIVGNLLILSFTQAFGVSPPKMLVTADAQNNQTIFIDIHNSENQDTRFNLGVLGVTQSNEGYPIFEKNLTDAENWVFPESNEISIKAKESARANFIINVPENSAPGSYYLGLFAEPKSTVGSRSGINPRIISILTLQVAGDVREEMIVERWIAKKIFISDKNWVFSLNLKNNGSVEVSLGGVVSVKNWRGQDIFSQEISLGNKLISGSKRSLAPAISTENKIKMPGLYQVNLKISYGLTRQVVSSVTNVWYFPVWSMIVLGVLFVAFLLGLFFLHRRKK